MSLMTYPLNDIDYKAEDAELFHCTRTSGVWAEDSFSISVSGIDNSVTVGTGLAWINNDKFSGKVTALKEPEVVDLGLPDSVFPRIDVVLLRFDANANRVDIAVKKGTQASNPTMPSIERSGAIYELYLAKVMRRTGASAILASDVTDLRFDGEVCGIMADPVTKIDTKAIESQVMGLIGELQQEIEAVKEGEGLLLRSDVVDSLTSSSTDVPLSANMGRLLHEMIKEIAPPGAGAHNSIYRGKNLGTSVSAAQYAAIEAGTFDDMYIGDYWVISGVTYRIAAFDYYYRTGDRSCDSHHVSLVPDEPMYTHAMNNTAIVTGAYVGSKMYANGLDRAKEIINAAFGSAHIMNHRNYFQDAAEYFATEGSWYDSTVDLMNELNVCGSRIYGNDANGVAFSNNTTIDRSQYPLFALRPEMISNRHDFWMRDVCSKETFASIDYGGNVYPRDASYDIGVRPSFSIC